VGSQINLRYNYRLRHHMKIAIIIPNDFSVVWFCGELVKALQAGGRNEVCVIADIHDGYERGHYAEIMKEWGLKHIPVEFYRFVNPLKDLKYLLSLRKILRQQNCDMVLNISTKPNLYGSIAARLIGVDRIVCSVWGLGLAFADAKGLKARTLRMIVKALYRIAFGVSDKVWFTNKIDHDYMLSLGIVAPDKAVLTKNYVNTEDFKPSAVPEENQLALRKELGIADRDKVVIMLARMSWAKGVREYVEAAGILRKELPDLKFLLVGPEDVGSSDRVPHSYLSDSEQHENFMWLGFRRDVKELYSISDVAVYPSYYREGGYPRGLTEPMAMSKPVITTDSIHCSGTVEHGRNGFVVPIKDSTSLAGAIRQIACDDELAKNFGQYSRMKAVNEFDETTIIRQVVQQIM